MIINGDGENWSKRSSRVSQESSTKKVKTFLGASFADRWLGDPMDRCNDKHVEKTNKIIKKRGLPIQYGVVRRDGKRRGSLEFTTRATPGGKLGGLMLSARRGPMTLSTPSGGRTDSLGHWLTQTVHSANGRSKLTRSMAGPASLGHWSAQAFHSAIGRVNLIQPMAGPASLGHWPAQVFHSAIG